MRTTVALAALATAMALPASAQNLTYGSWIPAAEYTNRLALPAAFDAIREATGGAVDWTMVAGGQLVNPFDTWDGVESGLVQGGMGIPQYVPSVVPATNTIYQTVLPGTSAIAAGGAALETYFLNCPQCTEEYRNLNMVTLSGWATAPYRLGCTKPVASVADMAGVKVRAAGGNVRLMEAAGAVPVAATLVEAINLLQTGAIDCIFGTAGWYRSFGYADFVTHHTDYPMGMTGPATGWIVNRDTWMGFSDEVKQLHLEQGARVSAMEAIGHFTEEERDTLAWAVSEKGVTVVEPADPDAFAALMDSFIAEQDAALVEIQAGAGVNDPAEIIAAYRSNYDKWLALTADIGEDVEALTALYMSEIYSKIDLSQW